MTGKYRVITLCGSARFAAAFAEAQRRLTLRGNIVLSICPLAPDAPEPDAATRAMLADMHLRRIDMADEIYVINVGGYIGDATRAEIRYAIANGKAVSYLEPPSY